MYWNLHRTESGGSLDFVVVDEALAYSQQCASACSHPWCIIEPHAIFFNLRPRPRDCKRRNTCCLRTSTQCAPSRRAMPPADKERHASACWRFWAPWHASSAADGQHHPSRPRAAVCSRCAAASRSGCCGAHLQLLSSSRLYLHPSMLLHFHDAPSARPLMLDRN